MLKLSYMTRSEGDAFAGVSDCALIGYHSIEGQDVAVLADRAKAHVVFQDGSEFMIVTCRAQLICERLDTCATIENLRGRGFKRIL